MEQERIPFILCKTTSPFSDNNTVKKQIRKYIRNSKLLDKIIELANRNYLIVPLYYKLKTYNLIREFDQKLIDYMREITVFFKQRNEKIKHHIELVINLLNKEGIVPLLMKGGSALLQSIYPDYAYQFMVDVDILISENDSFKAWAALKKHGYQEYKAEEEDKENNWERLHHLRPLFCKDNKLPFEIHSNPLDSRSVNILSRTEVFKEAHRIKNKKYDVLVMSHEHEVVHCFAHSELSHSNFYYNKLDLRHMDYFVRLLFNYRNILNWKNIVSKLNSYQKHVFYSYLYKARELFGAEVLIDIPSNASYKRRLNKSLHSCFASHNSLWKFNYLIKKVLQAFSVKTIQRLYEVKNNSLLIFYIIKRFFHLLWKYRNPYRLFQHLKDIGII